MSAVKDPLVSQAVLALPNSSEHMTLYTDVQG